MQEAVKVAIVVLWVGGALPPYTGLTCESIQPSSQTATLWLFVDSRHVAKVPEECLQVPNVRVVELGPHGVARRLASSLFDASKRARRADHSPRRRSGESWQQQLQRLMQTVPMESLSEYIPKASDELGNGHADWFTAFGASVIESYPKMLVELKPSWLWAVRSELLAAGHTHATFTDLDLVFGELSRWLTPELVWPFDVTTWGFEGDASRLFLRGQWTMIRLVGDGAEDLILRFTRCSYLSTRLLEYFEHRAIQHQANMLRGSSRASAAEENRELGLGRGRRLQLAEQAPVTSVPPTNYSRKELEEAFLMHRGPASASNSSIGAFMRGKLRGLLRQQLSYSYPALGMKVGECTTYDLMATDGQPLSAEGCYSCVMMTGKPTLRVRVVPAIFSDHLPGTVWWLQGRLSRLGEYPLQFSLRAQRQAGCSGRRAVAQYPANTTASADQLHCDAAEEVALVAGSGVALPLNTVQALGSKDRDNAAVAAFQSTPSLFLGANPSPGVHRTLHAKVHTGMSCRRLSWVGRTCPDARRCVRGAELKMEDPHSYMGVRVYGNDVELEMMAGGMTKYTPCRPPGEMKLSPARFTMPWDNVSEAHLSGPHCKAIQREAPLFHYRIWEHEAVAICHIEDIVRLDKDIRCDGNFFMSWHSTMTIAFCDEQSKFRKVAEDSARTPVCKPTHRLHEDGSSPDD